MNRLFRLLCCWATCWLSVATVWAEFALRDGDTVAFVGDSLTAARGYPKIVENYVLMRFPERRIRFINAGRGGDTAQKCLERLDRDVFERGATVMTVALGINDIGWGMKADEAHKKAYLDGMAEIIRRAQERGVRVFVCSPAITAEPPERAEQGFLQRMSDEALALARERGAGVIDVQRFMRAVQRRVLELNARESDPKKHSHLHVEDGVHLSELGQLVMGFAILKGLGAPAEVSSAEVDAASGAVIRAERCRITEMRREGVGLSLVRHDERLPMNLHPLWMLNARFLPIGEEFNQYRLAVKNLASGRYTIWAGGRELGTWEAQQIADGLNLASATANGWVPGGVWDAQGHVLKVLTDMRDQAEVARRGVEDTLKAHPQQTELERRLQEVEDAVVALQRQMAAPVPVRFEIKPAPAEPAKAAAVQPREVVYGQAGGETLYLDVYEPPAPPPAGQRRAGVVLVHGGGWCGGSRRDVADEARRQAQLGRVAFAVEYRLTNGMERLQDPSKPVKNRWPAALDDCQLAVRWIREHADEFQLDPQRLGAMGYSAGGHLVSLLGTCDTRNPDAGWAAHSSRVTAVINVFGPTNFLSPLPATNLLGAEPDPKAEAVFLRVPVQWLVDDFLGATDEALRRAASPQHHIDEKTVPFLTVFGARDIIVPVAQGREFHAALQAAGRKTELLEFPDEGHGFAKPDNIRRFYEAIDAFWEKHLDPIQR